MILPDLRKTVRIKFWSLRAGLGPNLGVILDIDTEVEREAYRVKTDDGWKWQIKEMNNLRKYDSCIDTDQETLDNIGSDLENIKILTKQTGERDCSDKAPRNP